MTIVVLIFVWLQVSEHCSNKNWNATGHHGCSYTGKGNRVLSIQKGASKLKTETKIREIKEEFSAGL
jgi:hypothetical protein